MPAPTVVIPAPFNATLGLEERLKAAGYTVIVGPPGPREDWTPEEIAQYATADVILASPFQKFGADVLQAAKNLRLIGSFSHAGTLPVNQSYSRTASVTLPPETCA